MARGFLSGLLWGGAVSVLGLGVLSVLDGPVMAPRPEAKVEEPMATAPVAPSPDAPPGTTPEPPSRPQAGTVAVSPGVPDEPAAAVAPGLETAPAPMPETGAVTAVPDAPEGSDLMAALPEAETPVLPNPQSMQPDAPAAEGLSITTSPAQPPAPQVGPVTPESDATTAADPALVDPTPEAPPASGDAGEEEARDETQTEMAETGEALRDMPENDAPGREGSGAGSGAFGTEDAMESADLPEAVSETVQSAEAPKEVSPGDPPGSAEGQAPDSVVSIAPAAPQLPQIVPGGTGFDTGAGTQQVGSGASELSQLAPEIETERLPRTTSAPADDVARETLAPLSAFSISLAEEPERPLMSIVLIDDGSLPLGLEALDSFPYPLTFAVPSVWEGAGAAMARYRAAGFEVMALADLPEAAKAGDVEVSLRGALDAVPQAVAVLEGTGGGLQGDRAAADQVARVLADSGHGLVLYPKGLNTAVSLAQRAGVPARALFRDFDAEGQSARVIRRFLDQAAFKAGQEGSVIMVGRLRADTISALLLWGLQDRAGRVSLVPVSAVLTLEDGA